MTSRVEQNVLEATSARLLFKPTERIGTIVVDSFPTLGTLAERLVITIGLRTITRNSDAVAIIMAAGEAKAQIVADAIQRERHVLYPATALHELKNARFYLTGGAAKHLTARRVNDLQHREQLTDVDLERVVFDVSIRANKRVVDLTKKDFQGDPEGSALLARMATPIKSVCAGIADTLRGKIEAGMELPTDKTFLHTEPHHDDIMLGYLPFVVRTIRDHSNTHYFATMTSGFTSVTNAYMLKLCVQMREELESNQFGFRQLLDEGYFSGENEHFTDYDVLRYLDGIAGNDDDLKLEGTLRRFLRNLIQVFDEIDPHDISDRVDELVSYFQTQYPGRRIFPTFRCSKAWCASGNPQGCGVISDGTPDPWRTSDSDSTPVTYLQRNRR